MNTDITSKRRASRPEPVHFDAVVRARFWERGWERAIEAREGRWPWLAKVKRKHIIDRWALALAGRLVARPNVK